jgi:tetratricopeptide (TPR) repeat protein
VLIGQSKFEEAKRELKIVSTNRPQWGLPHALLAGIHYTLDENSLAEQEIAQAIQFHTGDSQTMSFIASYYATLLDFDKAEEYVLKAIDTSNSSDDFLYLARIYMGRQKLDQAEKAIEDAEKLGASPVAIYLIKSDLAISRDDYATAETFLQAAFEEFPNDSNVWADMSFVHYRQGKVDDALAEALKALELNPYNSVAHVELAFALLEQGKSSEALAAAEKAVTLYPKYDRGHYILGLCYMSKGQKLEAKQELETFSDLYWDRPVVRDYKKNADKLLDELK